MNKWDKYKVTDIHDASDKKNRWDKYKVPEVKEDTGDSWPALIGKSALKGFSSIADLPKVTGQLAENFINAGRKMKGAPVGMYGMGLKNTPHMKPNIVIDENAPQPEYAEFIPSTEDVRRGVKKYTGVDLEPKPSSPAQRIVAHGAEFGSSMTPWGLAGKGGNLLTKFNKAAKLTKSGAGAGLTSGALQETGIDPLTADIAGSVIAPSAKPVLQASANTGKKLAMKAPLKLMGLSPKRLNIEAAQAARDLDIDIPAAALTDSTITGLADQTVSKAPFFGNILKDKYNQTQQQIFDNLNKVYNEVGPTKTPEIEKKIYDLYEIRKQSLPQGAVVKPSNTVQALDKIKINSALPSKPERELLGEIQTLRNELHPSLKSDFGEIKIPIQDYSVDRLIGTKQSLNNIIKWDLDEGVKNQLRRVQKGIAHDLEEYGKTNPKWYKSFKQADDLFAKVAKREKVETLLRNEGVTGNPEDLSYAMLSRSINDKNKSKVLQKHTSPETFEKIKKLGIVTKAMVHKNRRVPNPSGTAATAGTLVYLTGLYTAPVTTLSGTGIGGIVGSAIASKLLTDKRFVNSALKFAEEKGKSQMLDSMALNKRAKEITGYSLNSIYQNLNKDLNGKDGLQ